MSEPEPTSPPLPTYESFDEFVAGQATGKPNLIVNRLDDSSEMMSVSDLETGPDTVPVPERQPEHVIATAVSNALTGVAELCMLLPLDQAVIDQLRRDIYATWRRLHESVGLDSGEEQVDGRG